MAGSVRTALILGGLLAAGIGVAFWTISSDEPAEDGPSAPADVRASSGAAKTTTSPAAPSSGKTRKLGTAAVFGEIRRSSGKAPVVGQTVVLAPEHGEPWTVATDAQGAFRFDHVLHGGPYELSAAAKGCGTIRLPGIALSRNEQRNVGTLFLDPSVKATVRVRSNLDAPVAGALVEAFPIAQSADYDWSKALAQIGQASISVAKATTDAKGEALFPEMAVGAWTFTATKDGFATGGARSVALRSDEEPRPIVICLWPGHRLDGRVLAADKKPVAGALVLSGGATSAWDFDAAPLRSRTTTDAEGRYAFPALASGDTQLWVAKSGGVPAPAATVRIPLVAHYDLVLGACGTLAGAVTEKATGKPVEGATVRVSSWESGPAHGGETVTDAAGKYSLETTVGAVNSLTVEKEGLIQAPPDKANGQQRQAVIHEGETVVRDVAMVRGARLHGTVKGPDGPLAGVRVSVYVSRPGLDDVEKHATTAADGTYEFAALEKGKALVVAQKDGFYVENAPTDVWSVVQQPDAAKEFKVDVGGEGDVVRDLELKRGAFVEGRVDGPDGTPLAGARVSAPGATDAPPTGADGAFRLEGVTPGTAVQLQCAKEGLTAATIAPLDVSADRPTTGLVLRMLREPHVHGTATSKSGAQLSEVTVFLVFQGPGDQNNDSPYMESWRWQNATQVPVRADGTYDAPMQLAAGGKLLVRATSADAQTADAPAVDVVEGKESYQVDLALDAGKDLAGKVVAKGGAPVAGADVSIAPHRGNDGNGVYYGNDATPTVWAVSDAGGEFRLPHLAAGKYDVRAQARGYVPGQATADLAATGNVVVEMAPETTIEGSVAFADGRPVEGVEVRADSESAGDADAVRVFGGLRQQRQSAVTNSKGAFKVEGLADGAYTVYVSVPWGSQVNVRDKSVQGVAAGAKDLKIVVEEGGTIAGRVVDSKGRPVTHVYVSASAAPKEGEDGSDDSHDVEGGPDGTFTLVGLGAGPYSVDVSADDAAGNFRPKKVAGVVVGTKDLEVVLEDGLSIAGVVVDDAGKPLPQIALEFVPVDEQNGGGASAWTDESGKFSVSGLGPGGYRVRVARWGGPSQGWSIDAKEPVAAGTSGLRLAAVKGKTASGAVVDEDGAPLANVWVSATDPKDANAQLGVQSKADGTFEIAGLEKGRAYVVRAAFQGRIGAKIDGVQVGATGLKLVLAKGLSSNGRVLDANGRPLANGQLQFAPGGKSDEPGAQNVRTDEDGKFDVGGLVPGPYTANAWAPKPDGTFEWRPIGTFKAGDSNLELHAQ